MTGNQQEETNKSRTGIQLADKTNVIEDKYFLGILCLKVYIYLQVGNVYR